MRAARLLVLLALLGSSAHAAEGAGRRLFILSGQSNMLYLEPDASFVPTLEAAFPDDRIVVTKSAWGGRSITSWYDVRRTQAAKTGWAYRETLRAARAGAGEAGFGAFASVTLVWMQGTRDARSRGDDYAANLSGMIAQLRRDLERQDLWFVIGRLPPGPEQESWRPRGLQGAPTAWQKVRRAQQAVAEQGPRGAWIDTDDLERRGLHFSAEAYQEMGRRFAEAAIQLIRAPSGR